jgi:hypothetical protein
LKKAAHLGDSELPSDQQRDRVADEVRVCVQYAASQRSQIVAL